jgi:hypothetical protein
MAVLPWMSNEDIWVPVRSEHPVTGEANLSTYGVEVAVVRDDPTEDDWHTAAWEGQTAPGTDGKPYYWARLEIGPNAGTVTLVNGTSYKVYARITTPTNKPVVYSGTLQAD